MATTPVAAFDRMLIAAAETTIGTPVLPASQAAYAAQALEVIEAKMGPVEQGQTRPKRDRGLGRGAQTGWVQGRVEPIPFSILLSQKSRAAIDAAARESVLFKAAGLSETLNASTNAVYALTGTPVESSIFVPCTLTSLRGSGTAAALAEVLRGCLVRTLRWEGGDKELTLRVDGFGLGKYRYGKIDSTTLVDGSDTTLPHTAEESYLLDVGLYLIESEIIRIAARTDVAYGGTVSTVARAILGTSAVAHSSKPLYPYVPSPTYAGSPIAEPTGTVTIGGVTFRCMSWFIELTTGAKHRAGETGSAYRQGAVFTRFDVRLGVKLVLEQEGVVMLGKMTERATAGTLAVSMAQGTGTGGVATFSAPFCEFEPVEVPDVADDVAVLDVTLRARDNAAGNNTMSMTLT